MNGPTLKPDLTALLNAASACYAQGRLREASAIYQQAAAAAPQDLRPIYSLAMIDIRLNALQNAYQRLKSVLTLDPNHYPAHQNLGAVCQSLDRWQEAADAYARAHSLNPAAAETHFSLARALAVLGRLPEAVACYLALSRDPSARPRALTRLAALKPAAIDDEALNDLTRGTQDASSSMSARIEAYFGLGQVLELRGSDGPAFEAFALGNRLKHATLAAAADSAQRPDAVEHEHERSAQFVIDHFHAARLAGNSKQSSSSRAPIFIVGMPRSGSTLIEQVLSSHSQVRSMGESDTLAGVIEAGFQTAERTGNWRALADRYLESMRERGWMNTERFVDKTLENYLRVGAIHLMFPEALIIDSARDPMDTCLSCYRQLFTEGNETLYDLKQIGREYVRYRRVMEHWERVLPGRVLRVEHERLVADPGQQIRQLITEDCRLNWEASCLRSHETAGSVRTASAAQVRQPLFTSSIGRWGRFVNELAPLMEALGRYAPTTQGRG